VKPRILLHSLNLPPIHLNNLSIEQYVFASSLPFNSYCLLIGQANREDLEAANLVLSWWSDGTSTHTREQPPLHTDPVLPNPLTSLFDPVSSLPPTAVPGEKGVVGVGPVNLAAMDDWEIATPVEAPSGSASVAGSSGSGEARRITLKVHKAV